jgi:hypothetical protein
MLVGAADIRRYDFENDTVVDRLSGWIAKGRKVDVLNFDVAGFDVDHASVGIGGHLQSPLCLISCSISVCRIRTQKPQSACVARFNEPGIADESREVIPSLQQPIDKN